MQPVSRRSLVSRGQYARFFKMASKGQGVPTNNEEKLLKHAAQQIRKMPPTYKRKNAFVFVGLLSSVIGIYAYSMYAIQQEKIDFDKD